MGRVRVVDDEADMGGGDRKKGLKSERLPEADGPGRRARRIAIDNPTCYALTNEVKSTTTYLTVSYDGNINDVQKLITLVLTCCGAEMGAAATTTTVATATAAEDDGPMQRARSR